MEQPIEVDDSEAQHRTYDLQAYPPVMEMDGITLGLAGNLIFATAKFEVRPGVFHWRPIVILTTQSGEMGLYVPMSDDHLESTRENLSGLLETAARQNAKEPKDMGSVN